MDDNHGDAGSESSGTPNLESSVNTNEAGNMDPVNISGPNVSEKANDPVTPAHHNKSNETVDGNISSDFDSQGGITDSNKKDNVSTFTNRDESEEKAKPNAFFDDKQNETKIESDSLFNPNESGKKDDAITSSGHNKLEETNTTNISVNSSEVETTDDSAPSHDHIEHKRVDNKDTSSNQEDRKRKAHPNISTDIDNSGRSSGSGISYTLNEPDLLDSVLENATNKKLINRLLGCAYGQALGDAYGLSTEFEDREKVAHNYPDRSELIPFPNYVETWHNKRWKNGDWTDDTDQWILILETLTEHDGDVKIFAKKLAHWIRNGFRELGDSGGMGLGNNVSQVVHSHNYLTNPLEASEMVWERGNRQVAPNGAVMRCSASAFVHFNDIEKVISTTISMCKATHFDPRCIASCLAVCLAIAYLLREEVTDDKIELLIERVQKETIEILGNSFSEEHVKEFLWHTDKARTLEELKLDEPRSIGYTYKCLGSGFYGLRSTRPFKETLNDLIRYGGDADTNGAVCGTMYGARYGFAALPVEWLKAMPYKKWFDQKLIRGLEQMNLIDTKDMEIE